MTLLTLLTLTAPALAGDHAVLEGKRCDARGNCTELQIDLYDTGRFLTSDGLAGTYTMPQDRDGTPMLQYQIGRLGGTLPGNDGCFEQAQSPLNPDLGSIAVCLTIELQDFQPFPNACAFGPQWTSNPLPSESGHWSAGSIAPDGDMWVHEVSYYLSADAGPPYNCGTLSHRVRVYLGDEGSPPPANPDVIYEYNNTSVQPTDREVRFSLPTQVFVADDQVLWVAMEQLHDGLGENTCLQVCQLQGVVPGVSYWSSSDTTPYPWDDFSVFGLEPFMVRASGIYAAP